MLYLTIVRGGFAVVPVVDCEPPGMIRIGVFCARSNLSNTLCSGLSLIRQVLQLGVEEYRMVLYVMTVPMMS